MIDEIHFKILETDNVSSNHKVSAHHIQDYLGPSSGIFCACETDLKVHAVFTTFATK